MYITNKMLDAQLNDSHLNTQQLFIGQYHIWLAADTNGILVLVPDYPVLSLVGSIFKYIFELIEVHKSILFIMY